jgi:predicted nucleic acid-binding Zn ribbon protein
VRRLAPRPLSVALDRLTPGLAPPSTLARVQAIWADVSGPAMRGEAEPVSEHAGTVTFTCRSAVWAQELELLSPDLLERLNEALGGTSLTRLRFVAGGRRRPR